MANDPTYLSARQFAEHLVKDRGWHRIQPQQVKKYCRSGQISRAQLVDEKIWVIPRGAQVIRKRHAPKRPDGEMPAPQTRPEEPVEYAMALARSAGIR